MFMMESKLKKIIEIKKKKKKIFQNILRICKHCFDAIFKN